jgi:hypothetical protein
VVYFPQMGYLVSIKKIEGPVDAEQIGLPDLELKVGHLIIPMEIEGPFPTNRLQFETDEAVYFKNAETRGIYV